MIAVMDESPAATGSHKRRVLLVEDEPALLEALRRLLDREYVLEIAHDVDEAVGRLDEGPFDAVLADHHLPGKSGLDLLEVVKERHPDSARILLSGDEAVRVTAKRRARLVDAFLLKPASSREIKACVKRALSRRS
jgi:DNA-binding NtrC family response regulator